MKIQKIKKEEGYTVMSNYHFKDRRLSLKAKGLLSMMLSLSDNWKFSLVGLSSISVESEETIRKILQELKKYKYLKMVQKRSETGRFYYEYIIYEKPYES